jgi:signal transduction histidine kinase
MGSPMSDERQAKHPAELVWQITVLACLFILTGWVGRQLAFPTSIGTLMWPPGGLVLAALILYGLRLWPGIFIGSFVSTLLLGVEIPVALAIASVSTVKSVIGQVVLCRFLGFRPQLDRLWDVGSLLLVGGVTSAVIASIGASVLWLSADLDADNYIPGLWIWWRGDLGGVIAVAPLLLVLRDGRPRWSDLFARKELWLILLLLVGACYLTFGGLTTGELQGFVAQSPIWILIWAGARLGVRGAVVASFPTVLVAVYATSRGLGPFVTDSPTTSMSMVWLYCMSLGVTGLVIASAVSQRDLAEDTSHREIAERQKTERVRMLLQQRERIMREMHDGLGGQLVSVLSMVQRGQASPQEIAEGLRRALDDMRMMIDSLESENEGLRGLLGRLRARLEPLLRRNGLELTWRVDAGPTIDAQQALHCLRIIQEAVANVIQHAHAGHVRITVAPDDVDASRVSIEVSDDGVGGDPSMSERGHGMKNMLDRAREVGGEIRFEMGNPGRRVLLSFPVPRSGEST